MATRSMVREEMAISMGVNPMTMERILRVLGIARLIPSEGRGKRSGEFGAVALKNIILGAMAPSPGEAGEAVMALDGLIFRPNALMHSGQPHVHGTPVGTTLGVYVQSLIERLSDLDVGVAMMNDGASHHYDQPLEIIAEFRPASAYVSRRRQGRDERILEIFTPPESTVEEKQPGMQHGSKMRLSVLVTAGKLLHHTLSKQGTLITESSPGRDETETAALETTKAFGTGIHEGLLSDVPATRAYPALAPAVALQAQSATKEGSKQSASRPMAPESRVRQPRTSRSAHHGSHWTDTASP